MKNIAVCSNVNMGPLKNTFLQNVLFGEYKQYVKDFLDESSFLYREDVGAAFLHLDGEEMLLNLSVSLGHVRKILADLDILFVAIESFLTRTGKPLFFSSISFPPFSTTTYIQHHGKPSMLLFEEKVNRKIAVFCHKHTGRSVFFDFCRLVRLHGYHALYDQKYWHLGRIRYLSFGYEQIAQELLCVQRAFLGQGKKVLVLDLDNTLWGGVVGEDEISGIALSEDGAGKIYRDFQKTILGLKQIGILLCINSKNNENDIRKVFKNHKMMVLKENDFIIRKVNWQDKATNLLEMATELNLGLDAFVFIDDNPVERDLVRKALGEVFVPDFPEDITHLRNWFMQEVVYPCFGKMNFSPEDKSKTKQYIRNAKRGELQRKLSMSEYLHDLSIKLFLGLDDISKKERVLQMVQKTNQFNTTTKRYSPGEIDIFFKNKNNHVYTLEYEDKFGREGVVGVCIARLDMQNSEALLDSFLLSCRVLGRTVEYTFLRMVLDSIFENRFSRVRALSYQTPRNAAFCDFYQKAGFDQESPSVYFMNLDNDLWRMRLRKLGIVDQREDI